MITELKSNEIFVFGSNALGIHGAGAAKQALQWGAKRGIGSGLMGRTYAIPTKHTPYQTYTKSVINEYVQEFMYFALKNPNFKFLVTAIGCGHAGYFPEEIAPMFKKALNIKNIVLPDEFKKVLLCQI